MARSILPRFVYGSAVGPAVGIPYCRFPGRHSDFETGSLQKEIPVKSTVQAASVLLLAVAFLSVSSVGSQEAEDKTISVIAEHMHGHLDQISAVKAAVIAGKLADVREPATWLATHDEPEGLGGVWLPYVEEMRLYAARAAEAEDLVTAAGAISEIARACGGCHQASGIKVTFGYDERPPQDEQNLRTQMQRHLWAADRMWEGLIGPSDIAWQRGTDLLAEIQLAAADIPGAPEHQTQIAYLVQRARQVGEQGSQATSVELRSGLYGEFLALCASCHNLTGGGPAGR